MTDRLTTDDFVPPEKRGHRESPTGERFPDPTGMGAADRVTDEDRPERVVDEHDADARTSGSPDATGTTDTAGTTTGAAEPADATAGHHRTAENRDATAPGTGAAPRGDDDEPLFTTGEADGFQGEWRALQADFVDDPRDAVRRADELVAQVIQSLATTFAEHKRSLEGQWQAGGEADTEELRLALRRYRSFFDRLLSV
ncbi:hypothetical protein [Saccharothrix australiensis]|uniref:Uncharacterized protein n=1 Tax=Saccharothrix australiensis TaxID=2072 RepID=A0A495VXC0_9PSEU|nr:hypothetical protein [Saccharothrix australiensis]RKT53397.1 hypothetical protein C8E97_1957 [Saccharothrix australiensis]